MRKVNRNAKREVEIKLEARAKVEKRERKEHRKAKKERLERLVENLTELVKDLDRPNPLLCSNMSHRLRRYEKGDFLPRHKWECKQCRKAIGETA